MVLKYISCFCVFIIFQSIISCLKVDVITNNQLMTVTFNISEGIYNNNFSIHLNGSGCYQSYALNIVATVNETYINIDNTSLSIKNCSKLILNSSAIVDNNVKLNFLTTLPVASVYSLYLITNDTIIQQVTFTTPDGQSAAIGSLNVTSIFGLRNLGVEWSPPSSANGQILAYLIWLNNSSGSCVIEWLVTCVDCHNMTNQTGKNSCVKRFNMTFNNAAQKFSLESNDSQIVPFSVYNISLVAINGYGWGNQTSYSFNTSQYLSGPVTNIIKTLSSSLSLSVGLQWTRPTVSNGEIVQYVVNMSVNNTCMESWAINCKDCSNQSLNPAKTGLCVPIPGGTFSRNDANISLTVASSSIQWCTLYNVSIVAINGYGPGNISIIPYRTTSAVPAAVVGFVCTSVTYDTLYCSWTRTSGPSLNYSLSCSNDSITSVITPFTNVSFSDNIKPDIMYNCTIKACLKPECSDTSSASCSSSSSTTHMIPPSSSPDIGNATSIMSSIITPPTSSMIYVMLPYSALTDRRGRIVKVSLIIGLSSYNITNSPNNSTEKTYSQCDKGKGCPYVIDLPMPSPLSRMKRSVLDPDRIWGNMNFTIGDNSRCVDCNGPLSSNTNYSIGFRVCTGSGCIVVVITRTTTPDYTVIITVSVTVLFLFICVMVTLIYYIRRHNKGTSEQCRLIVGDETDSADVNNFEDYYWFIMKDSCGRASLQFSDLNYKWRELERVNKLSYITSNEPKDRYRNIKPYEHNVVKLQGPDAYINASKICLKHCTSSSWSQCTCNNCYIATQGPISPNTENKVATIGDFWKMSLQNNVSIIVNLTRCVESYKEKCAQYWPATVGQMETHSSGDYTIDVVLCSVTVNDIFEERVLTVAMDGVKRSIIQLHFTVWPDHDCPTKSHFLEFYNKYNTLRTNENSVVVHCSAGVGRSGTFILIDILLRKLSLQSDKIEIFQTLLTLRQCRCFMVQTEKQYIFVHEIIYEYLQRQGLLSHKPQLPGNKHIESSNVYSNPSFEP